MVFLFDNEFETTLEELIENNADSGAPLTNEEIEELTNSNVGDTIQIGMIELTKISNNQPTEAKQ